MLAPHDIVALGSSELRHLATVSVDQLKAEVAAGRWNPAWVWSDPRVTSEVV